MELREAGVGDDIRERMGFDFNFRKWDALVFAVNKKVVFDSPSKRVVLGQDSG